MKILKEMKAIDVNLVAINFGSLYQYPYEVMLRSTSRVEKVWSIVDVIKAYTPFVPLEKERTKSGDYLKVLTDSGTVGYIAYSARYLKEISKK